MKITKIEKQKNSADRFSIFLDGEFYSGIYIDTCVKYGLTEDMDIKEEFLKEILFESDKSIALNKTAKYISSALKSKEQVTKYLQGKGYFNEVIDFVIDKLEEYNYINDEEFVTAYINTYSHKYGKYKLKANLLQKGINSQLIDNYMKLFDFNDEVIYNLAKKYVKNKTLDYNTSQKLIRFLLSRGFSFDEISPVIEKLKNEEV